MGNYLTSVFRFAASWLQYVPLRPQLKTSRQKECSDTGDVEMGTTHGGGNEGKNNYRPSQQNDSNKDLEKQPDQKEQELENLRSYCNQLSISFAELQRKLHKKKTEVAKLRSDCSELRTRLSEMGAMQLTEGNPNIADLSDQNRPDKLAEQFSELYDNQWTDCYQILVDDLAKTEEQSIAILLQMLKISYDICLDRSQSIIKAARDILLALAGKNDGETDKTLESLILETFHKFKAFRTKTFSNAPTDVETAIKAKLVATIGGQEVESSKCYVQECVRICWLMCIKDPPLYIFCEKEEVFDKNHFMEYTEKGPRVSYVVWPALYLYKDGPMMRKGVAQGTGKRQKGTKRRDIPNSWANVPGDVSCEEYANTGEPKKGMMQIDIHQTNEYSVTSMNEVVNMCKDDVHVSLSDINVHVTETKDNTHGDGLVKLDEISYEDETKQNVMDETGKIYQQDQFCTKVITSVRSAEESFTKNNQGSTDLIIPHTANYKDNSEWVETSEGKTNDIARTNWSENKEQYVITNEIQTDHGKLGKEKLHQTQYQGQLEDIKINNDADDNGNTEKLEQMRLDETKSWKETDQVFTDKERGTQKLVCLQDDVEGLTKNTEESLSIDNQTFVAATVQFQENAVKVNNSGTHQQIEANIQQTDPEKNPIVPVQLLSDFEITREDGKGQKMGKELEGKEGTTERDEKCRQNKAREQPEENWVIYGQLSREDDRLSNSVATTCNYPQLSENSGSMRSLERHRKDDVDTCVVCGEEMNKNHSILDTLFEPGTNCKEEKEVVACGQDQHDDYEGKVTA